MQRTTAAATITVKPTTKAPCRAKRAARKPARSDALALEESKAPAALGARKWEGIPMFPMYSGAETDPLVREMNLLLGAIACRPVKEARELLADVIRRGIEHVRELDGLTEPAAPAHCPAAAAPCPDLPLSSGHMDTPSLRAGGALLERSLAGGGINADEAKTLGGWVIQLRGWFLGEQDRAFRLSCDVEDIEEIVRASSVNDLREPLRGRLARIVSRARALGDK